MSDQPPGTALQQLWVPGPHLGWGFQDRRNHIQEFKEPAPVAPSAPAAPVADTRPGNGRVWIVAVLGGALTVILGMCGVVASGPGGSTFGSTLINTAVLLFAGTVALIVLLMWQRRRVVAPADRAHQDYLRQHALWQQRWQAHYAIEQARVAGIPEWGTVKLNPDSTRLDVFGGGLFGWEALLTVTGASYLATHGPSLVIDLTGEAVCRELVALSAANNVPVDLQILPADLDDSDLLEGLSPQQLVDVIVESIHGGDDRSTRTDRAVDTRILSTLAAALGPTVSIARLVAGLRLLLGEPGESGVLAEHEQRVIRDELFSTEYRLGVAGSLRNLEAHLYPLRQLSARPRHPATLTAVAMATDGTSVHTDLLHDLLVAWLTRRIANQPETVRTLVIAGADNLAERHVARLADLCTRRGIRLLLMWRHLRDTALRSLGAGPVAFMKMGSHEEALHAADFIGRQYKFVVTGLTRSVGGSTTHTDGSTVTDTRGEGGSTAKTTMGKLTDLVRHAKEWSHSEASTWNTSRSWGTTNSIAQGIAWNDATTTGRVHEHAVEPSVLQSLPDYSLLLVQRHSGRVHVQALDCNPDMVNVPGVSMHPLPDLTTPASSPQPTTQPAPTVPAAVTHRPIPVQRNETWSRSETEHR